MGSTSCLVQFVRGSSLCTRLYTSFWRPTSWDKSFADVIWVNYWKLYLEYFFGVFYLFGQILQFCFTLESPKNEDISGHKIWTQCSMSINLSFLVWISLHFVAINFVHRSPNSENNTFWINRMLAKVFLRFKSKILNGTHE